MDQAWTLVPLTLPEPSCASDAAVSIADVTTCCGTAAKAGTRDPWEVGIPSQTCFVAGVIILPIFKNRVYVYTQRTGAAVCVVLREIALVASLALTLPVFHACGSASPFRARCCRINQNG